MDSLPLAPRGHLESSIWRVPYFIIAIMGIFTYYECINTYLPIYIYIHIYIWIIYICMYVYIYINVFVITIKFISHLCQLFDR